MNTCCTSPIETIASDKHKENDVCCLLTAKTPAPVTAICPVSGTSSKKVQHRTVEHLVRSEKRDVIQNVQYYYCTEPTCKVVYFSNENFPHITTDDVRVKVFTKDSSDDVNACYCFDWTRSRIKDEIIHTGKSTASLQIAKEIKAGNCTCDIKNPKGECCLGDVNGVVKETVSNKILERT
ncbi:MAG: copper chaperone Copz family protein [Ignavibacteriae bacterium]|nr:copper chaperone Copz family protein [Ignavibacteriota bacterium]